MAATELLVIGGSAGALDPLLAIISELDAAVTFPIAVVLHILPRNPSHLPAVLAAGTRRRVREPEDKEALEPNTIYVAPPNYHLMIERTRTFALSVDEPVCFSRPSIDVLFESAASALGPRVAALVLSGSNHDGADGLARIAAAGGVPLVQRLDSAAYPAMPAAAADRVPSARVLAPGDVPTFLLNLARSRENLGAL